MDATRPIFILLIVVTLAGCLGAPGGPFPWTSSDDQVPHESIVFDHGGTETPAIEGGLQYPNGTYTPDEFYLTLVTSEEATDRFDTAVLNDEAERFVDRTDFDRSFLIVFQAFPASSVPDYRVEEIEWLDDDLLLSVDDSSDGGTDDLTVETLLVRVDRGDRMQPDVVTVTTEEGDTISIETA